MKQIIQTENYIDRKIENNYMYSKLIEKYLSSRDIYNEFIKSPEQ